MRAFMKALLAPLSAVLAFLPAGCMHNDPGPSTPGVVSSTDGATQADAMKNAGVGTKAADPVALRPAAVDATKRFDYRDVYVFIGDPDGQRQLAYYFLRQNIWTIDKMEQYTDSCRHFRFRRLVGADGKPLPDVDPLAPKQ